MNIVSTMVGLSIAGAAAPSMMQMSIAPHEAQLRAKNLGIAESAAVVFAATYEGKLDIPPTATETCVSAERENTQNAYSVTCTHGSGKYVQSVTRAFRLAVPDEGLDSEGADTTREFAYETPTRYSGHQCPGHDAWGVNGYNDTNYEALNGACIPKDAWNQTRYQFSNPNAWLYDINNYNGWGHHPDYDNLGSCDDNDGNNGHGNSGGYDCSNPGKSKGTGRS